MRTAITGLTSMAVAGSAIAVAGAAPAGAVFSSVIEFPTPLATNRSSPAQCHRPRVVQPIGGTREHPHRPRTSRASEAATSTTATRPRPSNTATRPGPAHFRTMCSPFEENGQMPAVSHRLCARSSIEAADAPG